MRLMLSFTMALGLLSGCGNDQGSETLFAESSSDLPPAFVLMGGRTSCKTDPKTGAPTPVGMAAYRQLETVLAEVEGRGATLPFIASCYTSSRTVRFVTSDNPEAVMSASNEDFFEHVAAFSHRSGRGSAILAGHSYGGWLGLKATLHDGFETEALFTLDPISQIHCTPSRIGGCDEAPRDITSEMRSAIAEETDLWGNYYQRNDWFIRSNAMREADRNIDLDCNHNQVDEHGTVWQAIRARVLTALDLPVTLASL